MKQTNWLDLFQKLVDPYDMNDMCVFLQKAIGDLGLSMCGPGVQITPDFLTPFAITESGSVLGGTVAAGIGMDDNGQLVVVPTGGNAYTNPTADGTHARWDLLCLRFSPTPDTPIPKPTDPLTTVYQYLLDGFQFVVRAGTPGVSPAYPTKTPGDIIVAGIQVPAGATLGTSCTVDLAVQEQGYFPASKFGQTPSLFQFNKSQSVQTYLSLLDTFLMAGAANTSDDGVQHDYGEIVCLNGGTNGDTVTLGAKTFTIGTSAGQIPTQGTAALLALAVARAIREDGTAGPLHYAAAAPDGVVGIGAKAQGAVGSALSQTGTSFTVSGANISGHRARTVATGHTVKQQISQIDLSISNINSGGSLVPIGGSIDWYTETPPTNYLEMAGQLLLQATYPALFAVLGKTYGGDSTHFNLPDTRGRTTRSWDHAAGVDPDAGTRTAPSAAGATGLGGDHVGTTQADQIASHTHPLDFYQSTGGSGQITAEGTTIHSTGATNATGGAETRMKNIGVMKIMRVL